MCGLDHILGEVTIEGTGADTCRRCGTPYDSWGMCPKCDYGSDSGSSGNGSGNNESGSSPEPLPYDKCFIGSIMKALMSYR